MDFDFKCFFGFFAELLLIFIQELFSEYMVSTVFGFLRYIASLVVLVYILTVLVFPCIIIVFIGFLLSYHSQDVKHLFWEHLNYSNNISKPLLDTYKDYNIKKIYFRKVNLPKYTIPILYVISLFIPNIVFYSLIFEVENKKEEKKLIKIEKYNNQFISKLYSVEIPNDTFSIDIENETIKSFLKKFSDSLENEDSNCTSNCNNLIQKIAKHYKVDNSIDINLLKQPSCFFNIFK